MGLHLQYDCEYRGRDALERAVGWVQYLSVPKAAEAVDRMAGNDCALDHPGHEHGTARFPSVAWID